MPGMRVRSFDEVPDGTPSVSSWTGKVPTVAGQPTATRGLMGLLSEYGGVSDVPIQGLKRGGGGE